MRAWLQAIGLVLMAGTVFVAAPLTGALLGPLVAIGLAIMLFKEMFRQQNQ